MILCIFNPLLFFYITLSCPKLIKVCVFFVNAYIINIENTRSETKIFYNKYYILFYKYLVRPGLQKRALMHSNHTVIVIVWMWTKIDDKSLNILCIYFFKSLCDPRYYFSTKNVLKSAKCKRPLFSPVPKRWTSASSLSKLYKKQCSKLCYQPM